MVGTLVLILQVWRMRLREDKATCLGWQSNLQAYISLTQTLILWDRQIPMLAQVSICRSSAEEIPQSLTLGPDAPKGLPGLAVLGVSSSLGNHLEKTAFLK